MFITLEGGEGSGKTTIGKYIKEYLEGKGLSVFLTREPGGTRISEKIRELILDDDSEDLDVGTENLLFSASRRQLVVKKIIPALMEDKIVVCDRFVDSSAVYQGYVNDSPMDLIYKLNEYATTGLKPDLTILLMVEPDIALKRVTGVNRIDLKSSAFHSRVQEGFKIVEKNHNNRMIWVDASSPLEEVKKKVKLILDSYSYMYAHCKKNK